MDHATEQTLVDLRNKRASHQQAANDIRDQIYAVIRTLPYTCDKVAVERASGVSRPTIYRLLEEGHPMNTEPTLLTDAASVHEYIARLNASRTESEEIVAELVAELVADVEYTVGTRRTDGADWHWPDLGDVLVAAQRWQSTRSAADFATIVDDLADAAAQVEADVQDAIHSQ